MWVSKLADKARCETLIADTGFGHRKSLRALTRRQRLIDERFWTRPRRLAWVEILELTAGPGDAVLAVRRRVGVWFGIALSRASGWGREDLSARGAGHVGRVIGAATRSGGERESVRAVPRAAKHGL